jgi:hypothetical protein
MVWGRRDTLLTARVDSDHESGAKSILLMDTIVNNFHFWKLSTIENGQWAFVRFPTRTETHWHRTSELLFRKEDGILQSWHYILDTHYNGGSVNSEMWLTLTSIEGS